MPITITEVDEHTANIEVPAGADARTALSVRTAFQRLANRSLRAKSRLDGLSVGTFAIPLIASNNSLSLNFTIDDADGGDLYQGGSPTDSDNYLFRALGLPTRGRIRRLRAELVGAGAHAGLPASMPVCTLYRRPLAGSNWVSVASVTDDSGSTGAYQAVHTIVSADVDVTINAGDLWLVQVRGEGGANALAGLAFRGVSVDVEELA